MNTLQKTTLMLALALAPTVSFAGDDECAAIMCLNSMNPPSECKKQVKAYFKITEKKHGDFSGSRTCAKRKKKINDKCPDADETAKERVHAKYCAVEKDPFF